MFRQLALAVPGSRPASGGQDYSSLGSSMLAAYLHIHISPAEARRRRGTPKLPKYPFSIQNFTMKDMKSMKGQKTKIFKPFMLFMVPFVRSLLCANVFDL
jgi:hypothetical protein